jgi:hypothetical protein
MWGCVKTACTRPLKLATGSVVRATQTSRGLLENAYPQCDPSGIRDRKQKRLSRTGPNLVRYLIAMKALIIGFSLFAAVSLAIPSAASSADTFGVVSVADPPAGPGPELAELTQSLRAAVAERTGGVLEANEIKERMTGQTSTASLAELDRAYAGALETYQGGDFEGSIRTLGAIIEDLEKLPESPEAFNQWTRAMMRLARAESTLGRKNEAKSLLERLVKAAPDIKADLALYPPSFQKQIEQVRSQLRLLPTRKLKITTKPPLKGAKVYVDGRDVGMAPITIALPPGKYRVSSIQGSLRAPGNTVDLRDEEEQSVVLNFTLVEAARPSAGPGLALASSVRAEGLITAGAWLGVDKLVVTSFASQGDVTLLVGTLYDVRNGKFLQEGRIRLAGKTAASDNLRGLADFLVTGKPNPGVEVGKDKPRPIPVAKQGTDFREVPPPTPPGPPVRDHIGKSKTLGWVAFGAGIGFVGVAGFATYEGLSARSSYNKAQALIGPNGVLINGASPDVYQKHLSDGDSARKAAYIGVGGAGVCMVTAGILGYLSYKQTGEIGPFRF